MEVDPGSGDQGREAIEGHGTGGPVGVDSHPAGTTEGGVCDAGGCAVVPGNVALSRTEEAPRPGAPSQAALILLPTLPHPAVGHADVHPSVPLHFPVRAPGHTFGTQHLSPVGDPVRTVRTRLLLSQQRHTSVVL